MGFPTKNDHFVVFWGYHHVRKHPYQELSSFKGSLPFPNHCVFFGRGHPAASFQGCYPPVFKMGYTDTLHINWLAGFSEPSTLYLSSLNHQIDRRTSLNPNETMNRGGVVFPGDRLVRDLQVGGGRPRRWGPTGAEGK